MTFYHGTDARISRMSKEERSTFRKEIFTALDYMWGLMEPYFQIFDEVPDYKQNIIKYIEKIESLKERVDEESYNMLYRALSHDKARRDGLYQWQYQDNVLYFTSLLTTDINYAYRSAVFGELGETVWEMYQGMKALNLDTWKPGKEIQVTLDKIEQLATEEPFPVVYMFDNLDSDYLFKDTGAPIPEEELEYEQLFRYDEPDFFLNPNDKYHTIYLRPMNEVIDFLNSKRR